MKRNKMKYKTDGTALDHSKGCIAQMGLLALRNARRKIFSLAKTKHGHGIILSANKTGVRGTGKTKNYKRRKNMEFREQYCRPIVSNLDGSIPYVRHRRNDSSDSSEDAGPPMDRRRQDVSGYWDGWMIAMNDLLIVNFVVTRNHPGDLRDDHLDRQNTPARVRMIHGQLMREVVVVVVAGVEIGVA
jgi:hypothetical protein